MMQDEVNKIVFNALADGREIWFPGVGSLVPEFRSAWRASARQLERPSRRIAFLLSEQRGVSVIDLIARAGLAMLLRPKISIPGGSTKPGWRTESPFRESGSSITATFGSIRSSMPFSILSDTIRCR